MKITGKEKIRLRTLFKGLCATVTVALVDGCEKCQRCKGGCRGNCGPGCQGSCWADCQGSCLGDCHSSCLGDCHGNCRNNCYTSCLASFRGSYR